MTDYNGSVPEDIVYLGYVEKTHGLKGGLRVRLFQGSGTSDVSVGTVILMNGSRPLTVSRCTYGGGSRFNLTFGEIRNRDDAEELRNGSIYISRIEAEAKLGFIPLYNFAGLDILSRGCRMRVIDVEPAGANPMLLVEKDDNRFYVPVIMVMSEGSIDWKENLIQIDLPEGLEELPL
ncbi:MAG: hypothetical protein ABFR50_04815 [Candidatus Fermentibacteria bacterium]